MKYMLLVYANENAWTDAERQSCYVESAELTHDLHARGQYLGANPLQPVATATSVRAARGQAAGYRRSLRRDARTTGRVLFSRGERSQRSHQHREPYSRRRKGTIEVRPMMEIPGLAGG